MNTNAWVGGDRLSLAWSWQKKDNFGYVTLFSDSSICVVASMQASERMSYDSCMSRIPLGQLAGLECMAIVLSQREKIMVQ